MDRQTFLESINQPQSLASVPLAELQALALDYPYSPNLRLMILFKSILEGHPEEDAYLSRCSAAMFDRAHLYDLVQEIRAIAENDEVLELRDLEELALPEIPPVSTASALKMEVPTPAPEVKPAEPPGFYEERTPVASEATEIPTELPATGGASLHPASWAALAASFYEALPNFSVEQTEHFEELRPERPERFLTNQRAAGVPANLADRLKRLRTIKQQQPVSAEEKVTAIARQSVTTHGAVASETLAKLLVQQGQYQNALKMYQRLMLLYPEKKTIFAGLINELKEKL